MEQEIKIESLYKNAHFLCGESFDLENVNGFFKELITFLDCVDSELSQRREWEAEMRQEYYSYYYYCSDRETVASIALKTYYLNPFICSNVINKVGKDIVVWEYSIYN